VREVIAMHEGRVAVVTGGTRGIGRAITLALAAAGAHVAAGYSANKEMAESTRSDVEAAGGSISLHQGNVGEFSDCQRFVAEVLEEQGKIDFLINNAGINIDRTVRRMTIEDWHKVMRVNISGCFYMIKSVMEHFVEQRSGRIVNISSIIGQMGNIGQANYATAKAGMFGLTRTVALELANKGITVNCVSPGFILTDMMSSVPEPILEQTVARVPVGRLGTPEEIAHAVMFLVDDRSAYITGAIIPVNGGLDM
jgi:NAD(P)-dependent dehydrogenase (short-subunit alcohol dehydrogenase family)